MVINGEPVYPDKGSMTGHLPEGNDGLGLSYWVCQVKMFCDKEIYEKIKAKALSTGAGYSAGRYFKRRPGTKYLYLLY